MREGELDFETDRNATLKLIDWFSIERVRAAHVLVVGAGAIGNEVLKNLALLGVGHIYIFDRDIIEDSNLSRSVLYRSRDRHRPKAQTAAEAIQEINPEVRAYWRQGDLGSDLGQGFVRRMDAVIGCLDSVEARFILNRLCMEVGRTWIDAGIGTLNGQVRVFEPGDGACYACGFSEDELARFSGARPCGAIAVETGRQGRVPTTPTMASLVAAVQVQECLKILDAERWRGRTLAGRQFMFNGTNPAADIMGLPRRDDCTQHEAIDADAIVESEDLSYTSTGRQTIEAARVCLGAGAFVYLANEIAVERTCPNCGVVTPIMQPFLKLRREQMICSCGHEARWESDLKVTHVLSSHSSEALLDVPLSTFGVAPCGLVEVRGSQRQSVHLELTADYPGFMTPVAADTSHGQIRRQA